ncbi:MAG: hypothetical protein DME89_11955 [Verrucomicrobia bacterium]|nr:MAG: hypothetical protein DME89_11955 [Verrucomicrobiota bacterium]
MPKKFVRILRGSNQLSATRVESKSCMVSLAKLLASMICSQHEASVLPWRIDARPRDGCAHPYQLFNTRNANF